MKPHPGMLLHVLTWVLRGPGVPGWSVPTWTPLTKGSLLAVPTAHAQSPRVTERFPNVGTSDTFVEVSFGGCQGGGRAGRLSPLFVWECASVQHQNRPPSPRRCAPLLGLPQHCRRPGSEDRNSPSRSGAGEKPSFLYACLSVSKFLPSVRTADIG